MGNYSIRDLEKISGIKAHTIRIWEKRYNLIDPKRTPTNIRLYSDEDLKKLLNISILNRNGIKISKIAHLDEKQICDKIVHLSNQTSDYTSQIKKLVVSMIELNDQKFEKTISHSIMQIGFEETFCKIIYPLLEKIGIMWQTGSINPVQEHFVSNLIRQKLISSIDATPIPVISNSKRFVLFLPEGEWHELGLLFYYYILKKQGHKTIYLGQSLPINELIKIIYPDDTDYFLTSVNTTVTGKALKPNLLKLSDHFSRQRIFITGLGLKGYKGSLPSNMLKIMNPTQFVDLFKEMI